MDNTEEILLPPKAETEAMDRDDDLGRLFEIAFAMDVPAFQQVAQPGGWD